MIGKTNAVIGGAVVEDEQLVNYTMLYDEGNECAELTGGWESVAASWNTTGTFAKNASDMYLYGATSTAGIAAITNNKINVDGFSKIVAHISITLGNASGAKIDIALKSSKEYWTGGTLLSSGISMLDISSVTESKYLSIDSYSASAHIYHIFMVKEDDWQTWLIKGGLTVGNYASLDAVMSDTTALNTLMNSKDAVNYMMKKCTGTVMASVIQSSDALSAIRDSQYNAEIFANEHWCKFLEMVGETAESNKVYLYDYGVTDSDYPIETFKDVSSVGSDNTKTTVAGKITSDKISLTNFKKLCIEATSNQSCAMRIVSAKDADANTIANKGLGTLTEKTVLELDISSVVGDYYVLVGGFYPTYSNATVTQTVTDNADNVDIKLTYGSTTLNAVVYRLWLEK